LVDLTSLLRILAEEGGSDLHLKVGAAPTIRVDGRLRRLPGNPLTDADTTAAAHEILPTDRRERLEQQNEADFAYSVSGLGRFRVNVFRQRASISLVVFRWVHVGSPGFDELGLPPVVRQLADAARGLILVTGATGSGKTTTLGAMVDSINSRKPVHILTIEDPIEIIHPDRMATVNQRELGVDTDDTSRPCGRPCGRTPT
jgi:twitching motility protein PilT